MPHSQNIEELKTQLKETLFLDLDEYALGETQQGVVCDFLGIRLTSAYQPIVRSQGGSVLGREALLRASIKDGPSVSPRIAFALAEEDGKLIKLDRLCRTLHMLNYVRAFPEQELLFLNVHPKLLASVNAHGRTFERILHLHSVPTWRVVIEITESAIEDESLLKEAVGNYRDRGYKIAIDDFGVRHSNLDRLWRLSPDFVKLDGGFIREASRNGKVKRLLPRLISIFHELEAEVLLEGIEDETQASIARDSGADYLQGFHLGRPLSLDAQPGIGTPAAGIRAAA